MGNLPQERVCQTRVFEFTSLDLAGPFLIKEIKFRNKKLIKCYVCIFVCFSTKASHLELVSDLTAESFLNALKRFVARRGLPVQIQSDNATNLVTIDKYLKTIKETLIQNQNSTMIRNYFSENNISWKFISARSPHFGGLHESNIKCLKKHLRKTMHELNLCYDDFSTILCNIESNLNSRPLIPLSENPDDLSALTPAHFIIGGQMTALPEEEAVMPIVTVTRRQIYKEIQKRLKLFWSRWSNEYLTTLQRRGRWRANSASIRVGTLVLLKEDNIPSQHWRLGRIVEVLQEKME